MNDNQLYDTCHKGLYEFMIDQISMKYQKTLDDPEFPEEELVTLYDWIHERAREYANDNAELLCQEVMDED